MLVLDESGAPLSVLVVDDHVAFAELLCGALAASGMRPLGTASSAGQGVAMAAALRPGLVVMDIAMPGEDGITATRRIRELVPDTIVAIVTAHGDPASIVRATQAGASAFIPKNGSLEEMVDVLRRVRAGKMLVAPSTFSRKPAPARPPVTERPTLTRREQEVLDCLGRGMPPKAIARLLGISLDTCRGYVKSLHAKLHVRSQVEAVIQAQVLGLLAPPDSP